MDPFTFVKFTYDSMFLFKLSLDVVTFFLLCTDLAWSDIIGVGVGVGIGLGTDFMVPFSFRKAAQVPRGAQGHDAARHACGTLLRTPRRHEILRVGMGHLLLSSPLRSGKEHSGPRSCTSLCLCLTMPRTVRAPHQNGHPGRVQHPGVHLGHPPRLRRLHHVRLVPGQQAT